MYYFVYGFFYLVSLIPMRALYFLSDGIYLIVYYLFGYRKDVVMGNLQIAFPEKSKAERIAIAKKFYHHFIDSFMEVIKLCSASNEFLKKRFSINMDELDELYRSGKSCQVHLGHTFNWEWGQLVLATLTRYQVMVVYMPISNPVFEKLFYRLRTRRGSIFLSAARMREEMEPYLARKYLLGLVADQNPSRPETAYWLNFFGRPTPFVCGPEKGAQANAIPVVFAHMEKPKRGHYHGVVKLASLDASTLVAGSLTLDYVRYLEGVIRQNPSMWLWSHRRWKHPWKDQYKEMWIDDQSLMPHQDNQTKLT
jgi:Kdo2-lipid IVA lauroyltransferase/acyltransferase